MALKMMPGRMQEAIDAGAKSFSFDEARRELENSYAIATSSKNLDALRLLEELKTNYNEYLNLIRKAINREVSLEVVNKHHEEKIVQWYEQNIREIYK